MTSLKHRKKGEKSLKNYSRDAHLSSAATQDASHNACMPSSRARVPCLPPGADFSRAWEATLVAQVTGLLSLIQDPNYHFSTNTAVMDIQRSEEAEKTVLFVTNKLTLEKGK